jgi:hypothetical protein
MTDFREASHAELPIISLLPGHCVNKGKKKGRDLRSGQLTSYCLAFGVPSLSSPRCGSRRLRTHATHRAETLGVF